MRDTVYDHSRFEELCALELVDQLSDQERLEFFTHCSLCADCEAWLSDAHAIGSQLLISHQSSANSELLPIGADTRFLTEAHRMGISLPYLHGLFPFSQMKVAAAAVLLIALGAAMLSSLHRATHSVTQEAAERSEAKPENLVEKSDISLSSAVPKALDRATFPRRGIAHRAKREPRPMHMAQNSPLAAWSEEPRGFQIRPLLFDFSDCCHFFPQKPDLVQSPGVQAFRTFPRLGGAWPLAAPPERALQYEAAVLPMGASVSPTQSPSVALPSPQFSPFILHLEHTH